MNIDLPDPLALPDGGVAKTAAEWQALCAPWLRASVQREEYGLMPPRPQAFSASVVRSDPNALDGRATLREVDVVTSGPDAKIGLLVITPNAALVPSACFVGLNFGGNHRVVDDPLVRPPRAKSGVDVTVERGAEFQAWSVETIIERGYALVTLFNGDAVPDDRAEAEVRMKDFVPSGSDVEKGAEPATIACWAWTLSRAIDFLETDSLIDPRRIALVGHSRNGKTALLAGAMDERAAMVIPSQSGCGGAGPCRDIGEEWAARETVERINTAFPHWFCENFKRYNSHPRQLPFDQHALIALCAPRPVLLSSATEDLWANPAGSFAMLRAADPVYRLLTGEGIDESALSAPGVLLDTRLGHFLRAGRHSMTSEDWAAWLDYADMWL
jgi:hypothetical protein